MIGLPQLLWTIGSATARAQNLGQGRFIEVPGDLHHALDYVPDESPFWQECAEELLPTVVEALTRRTTTA